MKISWSLRSKDTSSDIIEKRYDLINQFEKMILHNGTRILKFYMCVSQEKQEERLRERITNPEKHWKHNDGDWDTLRKREQYLTVYRQIFERCNVVPWEFIPWIQLAENLGFRQHFAENPSFHEPGMAGTGF